MLISEANSYLIVTYDPPNRSLEPPLQYKKCYDASKGSKNGKNADVGNFWHIFAIFKPLTGT